MKFFVSGKIGFVGGVQDVMAYLKAAGHTITFDWTKVAHLRPYEEFKKDCREVAAQEVRGVKEADVLILLCHEKGVGMFVELGVALGNGIPVWIVTDQPPRSGFFYHPLIKMVPSIDDVLKEYV